MVLDGIGSVYDNTGWYFVSISWYCLVLGGTGSAKGLYACIHWKKWRLGRVLPMPHISQTTEYSATQLVYSIKLKLSHATTNKSNTKKTYVFKRHGSRAHFANCFWRIQLRSLCIAMNVVLLFLICHVFSNRLSMGTGQMC